MTDYNLSEIECQRCQRRWLWGPGIPQQELREGNPLDCGWAKLGPLNRTPGYVCPACLTPEERSAENLWASLRSSLQERPNR
jgi:hypothetical protein